MQDPPAPPDPSPILQTAVAFWSSKVLLTAGQFKQPKGGPGYDAGPVTHRSRTIARPDLPL